MPAPVLTLFVDGNDIQEFDGVTVLDYSGLRATGLQRGADDVVPGAGGVLLAPDLVVGSYDFTIPVLIAGATEVEFEENLAALWEGVSGTNRIVALKRRRADSGMTGYVDETSPGRFVALANFRQFPPDDEGWTATADLQFRHGEGAWSDDAGSTYTILP